MNFADDSDIAPLPECIAEIFARSKAEIREAPEGVELDLPYSVEQARKWLANKPAVGEDTPNDDYPVIAHLKDMALSPACIAELLIERGAIDCDWLRVTINNTFKYGQNMPGSDRPRPDEEVFAGVAAPSAPPAVAIRKWCFTRPSDDADQPPLAYWDEQRGARGKGMLPKVIGGCAVIVWGRKSSHKSGLLIKECLDAALTKGAKVLYLACEGAHGIRTSRLPAACRQRGISIEAIDDLWRTFPASPGLMNNAEIDELIARCREEGFEPDIIVIDTLTRAIAGFDINAPATGAGLILGMERLAAAFDATVVAVTHPGKDSDKGAIGSSLIESLAFTIWRVSLDGEAVFAEVQKMKDGPAEFSIPFKLAWADAQGNPVAPKCGTPVVVEVSPGEQLERTSQIDDARVSEAVIRSTLAHRERYGVGASMTEDELVTIIAGATPQNDDALLEWETRRKKIAHGLRSARTQKAWAKKLVDQQVRVAGGPLIWCWFLPERERPAPVAEPSGPW